MRNWWKIWWSEFRLKMYDVLINAARKLRTIQIDEAVKRANSPNGYEYFGNIIFKMNTQSDGMLLTLYQCPNKKFHLRQIRTEDFIHGIAMLPTAEKMYPMDRITKRSEAEAEWFKKVYEGKLPPDTEETTLSPQEVLDLAEWHKAQGR